MTTQSETPRVDAVAVSAVAREVTALTAQLAEARKVLLWSRQKLELYRSEHSGQYIGGMEYTELIRYIDAALAEPEIEPVAWMYQEIEDIPPFEPTIRCPVCWTYGHQHKKTCRHKDSGIEHHIAIDRARSVKLEEL